MRVAIGSKFTWPLTVSALLVSGTLLIAADKEKDKAHPLSGARGQEATQKFEGHLVGLFGYLQGDAASAHKSDSPAASGQQPAERAIGGNPAERRAASGADAWQGNANQPVGLVTEKAGILGLGSAAEFRLLVFDPADPSSERAYIQAQQMASKMATTGAAAGRSPRAAAAPAGSDDPDREYVRDPAQPAEPGQLKPNPKAASGKSMVSITGRLIERDGVQAIVVTSVQAAPATPHQE